MTAVDLSGFTLSDGSNLVDVGDVVSRVSASWQVGAVAELRVDLVDKGAALAGHQLLELGTQLTWGPCLWQVGSVDRTLAAWGVAVSVACRSELAKSLRLSATRTRSDKNVTPQSWITRRVAELGGTAVVQAGASRRTITQKRGESVLDVITAQAATMETDWVEIDGVMYVGTPWWAYEGGTGLPVWQVTWMADPATDALALSGSVSEDDVTQGASASLTLPAAVGAQVRPWHRVEVSGAGAPLDGVWLVGDVSMDVGSNEPVSLSLSRPLQSAPKKGSSAKKTPSSGSTSRPSTDTQGTTNAREPSKPVVKAPARTPARTPTRPTPSAPARTPSRTPTRPAPSAPVAKAPAATYSGGVRRPWASGNPGGSNGGTALDVGMPIGTRLYACRSGVVLRCRFDVRNHGNSSNPYVWPAAANYVLLGFMFNGRAAKLLYWHLSPSAVVHSGQRVRAGQLIGYSGNTGHSTGPHTHFQASWGHAGGGFGGVRIFPPSRVWS